MGGDKKGKETDNEKIRHSCEKNKDKKCQSISMQNYLTEKERKCIKTNSDRPKCIFLK